jgi:serine/threonine protein kinase
MQAMFIYDPARRITAKEALNHPYFDDLDKAAVDLLEGDVIRARECA